MSIYLLASLVTLLAGAFLSLFFMRSQRASLVGAGSVILASLLGIIPAIGVLSGTSPLAIRFQSTWTLFSLSLELDALSALFIIPLLILSTLASIYGAGYLAKYGREKAIGLSWFHYTLLVLCMMLVFLARDTLLFLLSWEGMALFSFFLVAFENEKKETRQAAWIYLVASQLSAAFLLPLFLILGKASGSLSFGETVLNLTPKLTLICFLLALIGFGTKAGIMPLHVWLPEAHPAAPSHISALMSGILIKTGIYGLLRFLPLLDGVPPFYFGFILLVLGAISGILGILFALAQHDLKRFLAYSSVENIGIILMAMGVGFLGVSTGLPELAWLGFGATLLHVINHSIFKGLLFMTAGAILKETHTREMDRLGGLLKRMPWTGLFFLTGSLAICGLPPFNGFVGEFLLYLGAFSGASTLPATAALPFVLCVGALAFIGGLAALSFTKAFGITFLGEPRDAAIHPAKETGRLLRLPMAVLAGSCLVIGLSGPWMIQVIAPAATSLARNPGASVPTALFPITLGGAVLLVLIAAIALFRKFLLSKRTVSEAGTWDCGYAAPSARMQYTESSFAQPVMDLFGLFLRTRKTIHQPDAYFPDKASLATRTPDIGSEGVFKPLFKGIESTLARFRILQEGRLQIYVLYIVLTLLLLLAWKLR